MTFTPKHGLVLAALIAATFTSAVTAKNSYRLTAVVQYKLELDRVDGTRAVACTFCHINSTGAAPWNPFGLNLRDTFRQESSVQPADVRIKAALYKVLAKKLDSDDDAYNDALEIYAGTLPGNALSTPKREVAELEAAFTAAGGYAQFKAPDLKGSR